MSTSLNKIGGLFVLAIIVVAIMMLFSRNAPSIQIYTPPDEAPLTAEEQAAWDAIRYNTSYDTTTRSHAEQKHPADFAAVRACKPKWKIVIRPSKYVDICQLPDGSFGFRPWLQTGGNVAKGTARWQELTAYIRQEITCYDDLVNFANKINKPLIPLE